MFVLDASVALNFLLGQDRLVEAERAISRMTQELAIAPAHWSLEIANILARELRRGSIDWPEAMGLAAAAEAWEVRMDSETSAEALRGVLAISAAHRLTAYDAAYLELCLRHELALATFDRQLAEAARSQGVELLL